MVSRFGTPLEKLAVADESLRNAYGALVEAQKEGDSEKIAAALSKLGDAQEQYMTVADAQKSIGRGLKSVGGSFDAWQAMSLTSSRDANQRLYDETRRQTHYLAEIARNVGARFA